MSDRRAPQPDWRAIRLDYPALAGRAYLDTACKGIPGSAAEQALFAHVRDLRDAPASRVTDDTVAMLAQFARARTAAAALIGASNDEIALVPSTEAGLGALASALRLERGTNVVASDLEFVGTVLPWRFLARRGVALTLVPHRDGRIDLADLDAAIDGRTRVVVASSVQEVNGFRVDLDSLSGLCRARRLLLVVDAIQHVGPLELDVRRTPVDAVAVGGHKWLCAPFGMGFLYVARSLHETLDPPARAFMTAQPATGGWKEYLQDANRHPGDPLVFPTGALQLERAALGTTMAAAGLAAALETLLAIGRAAIAGRSAALARATEAALETAGAEIVTPRDDVSSSIVTFRTAADVAAEDDLIDRLARADVLASLRFTTQVGGIRVSPYFYNDASDVERLATIVADTVASRARRRRAARER